MKKLLEGIMGITETKIFMLDTIIKLANANGGKVSIEELRYIKEELIIQSRDEEMGEALNSQSLKSKSINKTSLGDKQ